jgi:hypothetical protein
VLAERLREVERVAAQAHRVGAARLAPPARRRPPRLPDLSIRAGSTTPTPTRSLTCGA